MALFVFMLIRELTKKFCLVLGRSQVIKLPCSHAQLYFFLLPRHVVSFFNLVGFFVCLFDFFFFIYISPDDALELLLTLCSGLTPGKLGETYGMLGIELRLVVCKSALPAELSLQTLPM